MKKILFCISILYLANLLFAAHTDYFVGVSASEDHNVKYWDLQTGSCIRTMTGHTQGALAIDISPDARYALSGSMDNTLKYWDLLTGSCIRTMTGHNFNIWSVAISTDGQYAISGSEDKTLKYWRLSDGTCVRTITGHTSGVWSVAISTDGQYAVSGSVDNTLKYWRLSDGACLRTMTGHTNYVFSVDISPDGQYALSGSYDKTIKYWRLSDGSLLRTMTGHTYFIRSVAFSPDGQYALSGSDDNTLKYWRLSDGTCIRTITGHAGDVYSAVFSEDGQYALSGGAESNLKYWRISDGVCLMTMTGHTQPVWSVAMGKAYLDVIYPNGGETLYTDDTKTITWSSVGTVDSVKVDYTTNNGSSWIQIAKIANTGSYSWLIPNTPSTQCKIKLTGYNGTYQLCQDQSDGNFTIAKTIITVISPNGGESWKTGNHYNITWTATPNLDSLSLAYTTNLGNDWSDITRVPNNGSYDWTIPDTPSNKCLVRVTGAKNSTKDQSDDVFTIYKGTGFNKMASANSLPVAFKAAPSPFKSELRLSLPEKAVIYDLSGKRIASFEKGVSSINTSIWQAGVYIIHCGKKTMRVVKID